MKHSLISSARASLLLGAALLGTSLSLAASALPARADADDGPPPYLLRAERNGHVLVGTVASFAPYRLLLARGPNRTTQVDLHDGTVIEPTGTSLTPGMHVLVRGYWSKGTFIANRIVLR
jgi:hypothetical protein